MNGIAFVWCGNGAVSRMTFMVKADGRAAVEPAGAVPAFAGDTSGMSAT